MLCGGRNTKRVVFPPDHTLKPCRVHSENVKSSWRNGSACFSSGTLLPPPLFPSPWRWYVVFPGLKRGCGMRDNYPTPSHVPKAAPLFTKSCPGGGGAGLCLGWRPPVLADLPLACVSVPVCHVCWSLNKIFFIPVCNWQMDYYYEYTECDSTGSRWRVAIPQSPGACTGLPEPVRGTECSEYMCVNCVYLSSFSVA